MDTRELEALLPLSSEREKFLVLSMDAMVNAVKRWQRGADGGPKWRYIIFNCCPRGMRGEHWRLLILPPRYGERRHQGVEETREGGGRDYFYLSTPKPPTQPSPTACIILFDSLALPLEMYPHASLLTDTLCSNQACLSSSSSTTMSYAVWQNRTRVQSYASNTCGAHCLFFIHHFKRRLKLANLCSAATSNGVPRRSVELIAQSVLLLDYGSSHGSRRHRNPKQCDQLVLKFIRNKNNKDRSS